MSSNVLPLIRGSREAPRSSRSRMDTLLLRADEINQWRVPPFQRPVRVNEKVRLLADDIQKSGVLPGIVTLGRVGSDKTLYIVDGQHRCEALRLSAAPECIVDVRIVDFDSLADMADEFVSLNSALVKMRPDDILRGLEGGIASLKIIREKCSFVGYDQVRRGTTSPIVSMSALLRCWSSSSQEIPGGTSTPSTQLARGIERESAEQLVAFMNLCVSAWGRESQYFRLWGNLNLTLCAWLYRRVVLDRNRQGNKRVVVLTAEQFKRCLMSLSADGDYLDWLTGRLMNDRDRSPAYMRIKASFARRVQHDEPGHKPNFPSPAWSSK